MPQFGETVTEGELTRWLVSVGDTVVVDPPIAEISTDKVDAEVVASDAGTVTALLVDIGTIVVVGAPLLELDGGGEVPEPAELRDPAPPAGSSPVLLGTSAVGRVRSTPKARRLAAEFGVDVATLAGTGHTVRAADVVAAVAAADGSSAPVTPASVLPVASAVAAGSVSSAAPAAPTVAGEGTYLVQHSRIRRITAQRTRESLAVSSTAWSVTEVDYANVDLSRKPLSGAWKARYGSSLTYLPFVLRAVSLALTEYPHLNAQYREDGLLVNESVNLGVAVDLGAGGLSVPVIRDAQSLSVVDTALELNRVAGAARSGTLGADDYAGSTFAVTNNGSYGSVLTMPIINQPNVGILSFDAVTLQPAVVSLTDGSHGIAVRPKGALALSWDHRAIDGAYAAKFLTQVKSLLETTAWDVSLPA
jgi:2-oxoglutarate dehydrogenase E2 component (dihydrolipoamide succinyltransferase)